MDKLQFGITVCWSMLCFVIAGLGNQRLEIVPQGTPEENAKAVVREVNRLEHEWYKDPTNEDLRKMYEANIVLDGPRHKDVTGRIKRAKDRGDKAKESWCREDQIEVVALCPHYAIVRTIETSVLEWTKLPPPGGRWEQTENLHIYVLKPEGLSWKVEDDIFNRKK